MAPERVIALLQAQDLDTLKAETKVSYRRLALDLHPDRPDGDMEKMKALNAAWELAQSLQKGPPRSHYQPPPVRWRTIVIYPYGGSTTTYTNTSTSAWGSWPW